MCENRFYSHKELSMKFQVSGKTLKKELKKISKLKVERYHTYTLLQAKIIFKHLGDPYE